MEILLAIIGLVILIIQGIQYIVSNNITTETPTKLSSPISQIAAAESSFRKQARTTYSYHGYNIILENIERNIGKGGSTANRTRIILFANQLRDSSNWPRKEIVSEKQDSVEDVVNQFITLGSGPLSNGQVNVETKGEIISYEQSENENDRYHIQLLLDKLCNLADIYPKLITLGGEVVPHLQAMIVQENFVLQSVATQLLQDITRDTTTQLGYRASNLLCPSCLMRFGPHKISVVWWKNLIYYGCRACGQSRSFFEGKVILTLNNKESSEHPQQDGVLEINWLTERKIFDFDEVAIIDASDEDVERFTVQIGNDIERRQFYQQMGCKISSDCKLSENTLRILRRVFGHLEISN